MPEFIVYSYAIISSQFIDFYKLQHVANSESETDCG